MSGSAKLTLQEWLQERYDNCIRHAVNKTGEDKEGWLEDADYFKQALTVCAMRSENNALEGQLKESREYAQHLRLEIQRLREES